MICFVYESGGSLGLAGVLAQTTVTIGWGLGSSGVHTGDSHTARLLRHHSPRVVSPWAGGLRATAPGRSDSGHRASVPRDSCNSAVTFSHPALEVTKCHLSLILCTDTATEARRVRGEVGTPPLGGEGQRIRGMF